jgi:hypothetical protein
MLALGKFHSLKFAAGGHSTRVRQRTPGGDSTGASLPAFIAVTDLPMHVPHFYYIFKYLFGIWPHGADGG